MQTVFFWITWGVLSSWLLRRFYFTFGAKKILQLKYLTLGFYVSVLALGFLSWLPAARGSLTGWQLVMRGEILVVCFFLLLIASIGLLLTNNPVYHKLAVILGIGLSVLVFMMMIRLMPGSVALTFADIAPIVATFILLFANVTGLLLWQQSDLKINHSKRTGRRS
ncbi:MAG: hypothetical protein AAB874_07645 [Patescibacteria group bacterium]